MDGGKGWSGEPGKANYRIDGLQKVLGKKVYARDFHSSDMPGWPASESYAYILRSPSAGLTLNAIDLKVLPPELQPYKVVTNAELTADGVVFPFGEQSAPRVTTSLFTAVGEAPEFMGQPVAVLLFKDFNTYREARKLLQFNLNVLQFGSAAPGPAAPAGPGSSGLAAHKTVRQSRLQVAAAPSKPNQPENPVYAPPTYITRYADGNGEQFSQVASGTYSDPYPPFPPPPATGGGPPAIQADSAAFEWRLRIRQDMQSHPWRVFEQVYETQQLDPMFMEPETGIGWWDQTSATLSMVVGTQSPDECASDGMSMFKGPKFSIKTVVVNACYPGGGFGGRDVSTFPTLLSIAAVYANGPVRLAYDRFDQFQSGIKQLGATMKQTLAVDAGGKFQAVIGDYRLQAGGRNNYSQFVAQLAGYCGGGGYAVPRVSIDAVAEASTGVIAGSMRGFGGPQAAFATESLVDEIALELKTDPILLREKNALARGGNTVTGYRISHSLRIAEICRLARAHPLWVNRHTVPKAKGKLYGVGFALANQAFGTGHDGVYAAVEIGPDGSIGVTSNAVDIGNGSATSLAISTAMLGANASRIDMGDASAIDVLKISNASSDWTNPRYTTATTMSSSACITAFQQVHAVEQACRVLLATSVWPAARGIWGLPAAEAFDPARHRWRNGALHRAGKPPIPLAQIAAAMHKDNRPAAATIHASFAGQWVVSRFAIDGASYEGMIDALALRRGGSAAWELLDRVSVVAPPSPAANAGRTLYSPSATLAAVEVDEESGVVAVKAIHTILEAGRIIQPDLVSGQYQGGVAMGVGYALYEYLPRTAGGPGDGTWNLNRYRVARSGDLPLKAITLHLLDPVTPDEPARGIAEAVLCPIAPAISNAVSAATGKRLRSLPITPRKVREALGK